LAVHARISLFTHAHPPQSLELSSPETPQP
jgi:hypothetical protein